MLNSVLFGTYSCFVFVVESCPSSPSCYSSLLIWMEAVAVVLVIQDVECAGVLTVLVWKEAENC